MAKGGGGYITFTISDGGAMLNLQRRIMTWGIKITSLEPALEAVGLDLEGDFMQNMIAGGGLFMDGARGAAGGKWAPLAPSTIREKQRLGYGEMPIMWRTGDLAESLAIRGAPGNIFEVDATHVSVGTSIFYARFHQDGSQKQTLRTTVQRVPGGFHLGAEMRPTLPRRMLVGIRWNRVALIVRRINEYVQEQARAAGLTMFGG